MGLVDVAVRPSAILNGEIGLFALREFAPDEIVLTAGTLGEQRYVRWVDLSEADPIDRTAIDAFGQGDEHGVWIPQDFNAMPITWLMNHSCTPNIGFDQKENFVACRLIEAGDELSWDYSFGETNPRFEMICRCGSEACRGKVTGNDWKGHALSDPFSKYLHPDVRQRLAQFRP